MGAAGPDILERQARAACAALLGLNPQRMEQPGRRRWPTFRAYAPGKSVIITRRKDQRRATLEAGVLSELAATGAPVPRVLAFDGEWLIQEDLGARRLSQALAAGTPAEIEAWLDRALGSLARIHRAAASVGLPDRVAGIGTRPGWVSNLSRAPSRVGAALGHTPPALPHDALDRALGSSHATFVKWDARPGNAVAGDGDVTWFDWEHCGCREPLDDMAWLLTDEYTPDLPDVEDRLIAGHLETMAAPGSKDAPLEYLMAFGALHTCIRLRLVLGDRKDGRWRDGKACLEHDKIGTTFDYARTLCERGARWASRARLTEALVPWFRALPERMAPDAPRKAA
jgi:hypothetical protein